MWNIRSPKFENVILAIQQLFERLEATNKVIQNRALAEFAMFLEQNRYPKRNDEIWRILPDDLFGLVISAPEIAEMVTTAITLIDSGKLSRDSRSSLMRIIVYEGRMENAEKIFGWFSETAASFDEQEAFSFLACFSLFLLRIKGANSIKPLVQKFDTMKTMDSLKRIDSERLSESIFRLRKQLNEMLQLER